VRKKVALLDFWIYAVCCAQVNDLNMYYEIHGEGVEHMCRNIKPLYNFDPPVNDEEVSAAALQYVRKISGFNKPSKANEVAFYAAAHEIAAASSRLLASLETNAPPRNREVEAEKARAQAARRFAS
jgi:hypothetical protein